MVKRAGITIPFDADGNLMHYPEQHREWRDGDEPGTQVWVLSRLDWRPNLPFEATLTFHSQHRGRSAAYFEWTDETGHRWPMFMADIADLLARATIAVGVVTGRWIVQKRGQNYGLRLATETDT